MNQLPVIDVHGMNREDAIQVLRLNLKHFHNQGFHEVTIVHGHGQGILRTCVRAFLEKLYYVKDIKSTSNDGATIAIF